MDGFYKTRLRARGQVTMPREIRERLNVSEGDDLIFSINEQGQVVVERVQVISADQAWFWTDRWQRLEREAQADIDAGHVHSYTNVEKAISELEVLAHASDQMDTDV